MSSSRNMALGRVSKPLRNKRKRRRPLFPKTMGHLQPHPISKDTFFRRDWPKKCKIWGDCLRCCKILVIVETPMQPDRWRTVKTCGKEKNKEGETQPSPFRVFVSGWKKFDFTSSKRYQTRWLVPSVRRRQVNKQKEYASGKLMHTAQV